MQCNQKNDEKKEKYQLWIWFCSNNTKFSKLRNLSKKCMADRAENLQLYLGRRGRGRSLML